METFDVFWFSFGLAVLVALIITRAAASRTPGLQPGTMSAADVAPTTPRYVSPAEMPTIDDVGEVKRLLHLKRLPLELIDNVIDFAEYWPYTSMSTTQSFNANNGNENVLVLRSLPLGYVHDNGNGKFDLPLEVYSDPNLTMNTAAGLEFGDAVKDSTINILNQWTTRSSVRKQQPCRKIVFTIKSRDQGWGGLAADHGTYKGSYSWFDVGQERVEFLEHSEAEPSVSEFKGQFKLGRETQDPPFITCLVQPVSSVIRDPVAETRSLSNHPFLHPFLPSNTRLQSNLTASRKVREHVITWSCDDRTDPESLEGIALEAQGRGAASANGEVVRNMKIGDIVTVWARARFPGWSNQVESLKVDVYWAV